MNVCVAQTVTGGERDASSCEVSAPSWNKTVCRLCIRQADVLHTCTIQCGMNVLVFLPAAGGQN